MGRQKDKKTGRYENPQFKSQHNPYQEYSICLIRTLHYDYQKRPKPFKIVHEWGCSMAEVELKAKFHHKEFPFVKSIRVVE